MTFALDDVLDALELPKELPSRAYLARVFERFNARVPFETVSKILRDADVSDPASKPRVPEVFWGDFLESGLGGTCFARVAAFDALLSALGFATRKALGRVEVDFDHAALFVSAGQPAGQGGEWLADVGFPLPAILPAGGGEVEAGTAGLAATPSSRGLDVRFVAGVPGGPRAIAIFDAPVSEEEFLSIWRRTFRPESKFLRHISLHRRDATRAVVFWRGEVRIDDLHSRARIPIHRDRPARIAQLFDVDEDLVRRAMSKVGDPDPEIRDARITAYLSTDRDPGEAFGAIGTPDGYRRLMEGAAEVAGEGWRLRLFPPGAADAGFDEEVTPDAATRALSVARRYADGREVALAFRVEVHGGETWLVREAVLSGPREDLLVNDHARGRLAGTLAVDLLAWARRIGEN